MAKLVNKDFVEALARGLDVIKAFSLTSPVMTSAQVATKTGLARPTAHRLLLTLEALGYVRSEPAGFSLTPRVIDLGMAYISSRGMWDVAKPHIEELAAILDQCCSVSQLDGGDSIFVAGVTTPKVLVITMSVGTRSPNRSTSMGDVLLADLTEEELHRTLAIPSKAKMKARLSRTDEEFADILPQVRRQGYAISDQRLSFGVRAISVPIIDSHGRTAATLNTPVHVAEVTVDQLREDYLPQLLETARKIGSDLVKFGELPQSIVAPTVDQESLVTLEL